MSDDLENTTISDPDFSTLHQSLQSAESIFTTLKNVNDKQADEIRRLKELLEKLRREKQTEGDILKEQIAELQKDKEDKKKEAETLKSKVARLEKENMDRWKESKDLKEKLNELQKEKEDKQKEADGLKVKIAQLEKENADKQKEEDNLKEKVSELEREIDEKQKEEATLKDQIAQLEKENLDKQKEGTALKDKISQLQNQISTKQDEEKNLKEKIGDLQKENSNKQKEEAALKEKLAAVEKENTAKQEEEHTLNKKLTELEKENNAKQEEEELLKRNLAILERENREKQEEERALMEKLEKLERQKRGALLRKRELLPDDPSFNTAVPFPVALVTALDSKGYVDICPIKYWGFINGVPKLLHVSLCQRGAKYAPALADWNVKSVLEPRDPIPQEKKDQFKRRYSAKCVDESGEMVINIPSIGQEGKWLDTANHTGFFEPTFDKWASAGYTKGKSKFVKVPYINECIVNIECRVVDRVTLPTHDLYILEPLVAHTVDGVKQPDTYTTYIFGLDAPAVMRKKE